MYIRRMQCLVNLFSWNSHGLDLDFTDGSESEEKKICAQDLLVCSEKSTALSVLPTEEMLESESVLQRHKKTTILRWLLIGNASDCSQIKADCNTYNKCMQIASTASD